MAMGKSFLVLFALAIFVEETEEIRTQNRKHNDFLLLGLLLY